MRALLDVNVLIALFDEEHVFNDRAHVWLENNADSGIATCPITENGLVRILSHPKYSKTLQCTPAELIKSLAEFVSNQDHLFWPDDLSIRSTKNYDPRRILGSRQLTDIYLLSLAVKNQGRLVSFDNNIAASAILNSRPEHLLVI